MSALEDAKKAVDSAQAAALEPAANDQRCWEELVAALGHIQGAMSDLLDNGWPERRSHPLFALEVLGPDGKPIEETRAFRIESEARREARSTIERLLKAAFASGGGSFRVRLVERDEFGQELRELVDERTLED